MATNTKPPITSALSPPMSAATSPMGKREVGDVIILRVEKKSVAKLQFFRGQGQVIGGSMVGLVVTAGTVVLMADSFSNAMYERLPIETDADIEEIITNNNNDSVVNLHHHHQPEASQSSRITGGCNQIDMVASVGGGGAGWLRRFQRLDSCHRLAVTAGCEAIGEVELTVGLGGKEQRE